MSIFSRLFGIGREEIVVTRIGKAAQYIEEQGTSGITRHYHAKGVVDSVERSAGVRISEDEAMNLVEDYRRRKGWGRRSHESYFPSED